MSLLRVHRSYCAIARKNRDLVASIGKYDTVEIDFGVKPFFKTHSVLDERCPKSYEIYHRSVENIELVSGQESSSIQYAAHDSYGCGVGIKTRMRFIKVILDPLIHRENILDEHELDATSEPRYEGFPVHFDVIGSILTTFSKRMQYLKTFAVVFTSVFNTPYVNGHSVCDFEQVTEWICASDQLSNFQKRPTRHRKRELFRMRSHSILWLYHGIVILVILGSLTFSSSSTVPLSFQLSHSTTWLRQFHWRKGNGLGNVSIAVERFDIYLMPRFDSFASMRSLVLVQVNASRMTSFGSKKNEKRSIVN
ncbi:unnamed protein product [Albugo candida]|uniref:Uncharacterized protein n=1 Tax=Albugo candida TaxID=65357 RepID=A0A024FU43_9STRA|nr:unnamed protein product [Albugo candida]|eukprot:CCI10673.1 unnamed protein product [Albugo candida]